MIQFRRDFHQYPVLGCEEYRTAERIVEYTADCEFGTELFSETGILGMIQGEKKGPILILRADLDVLSLDEMASRPYKAKNHGQMHAYGHLGHMNMRLVAIKILARLKMSPFWHSRISGGKIRVSDKARIKIQGKVRELTRRNNTLSMYQTELTFRR